MFDLPPEVREVCRSLHLQGHAAFVVGGAVRDLLMGREPHDYDVATNAKPNEVLRVFPHTYATGLKHGTVTVHAGEMDIEVTTFRADQGCADGRHPDEVVFVDDIEQDLARRDFTMNALALNPTTGTIVDPFGGERDINNLLIRAVGDPHLRFTEDGLRCLRAVRFMVTLGFNLDEATKAAIPAHLDILRKVSAERVRDELCKMLVGPEPARGIRTMVECFMLEAVGLPEIIPLIGQRQNRYHRWDVFEHTMAVLNSIPPQLHLRLAALLHDIGKPATAMPEAKEPDLPGAPPVEQPGFRFFGHAEVSAKLADEMLKRLKFPNADRERVVLLVLEHMSGWALVGNKATGSAIRRFIKRVGKDNLDALFALFQADALGTGTRLASFDKDLVPLRAAVDAELARPAVTKNPRGLAVDGATVMQVLGIGPSAEIGRVLAALSERVLDDPDLNTPEKLTALIRTVASGQA
jgi:tRNA nucleotidyltransferase (CCA-adding enzyme)